MKNKNKRKNSRKFLSLVKTAQDLFFRFGMKRVTVEEICQEAGVSKMTFYKYFENKTDLALYILDETITAAEKKYESIMKMDVPFAQKVEKTIRLKLEQNEKFSREFFRELLNGEIPEVSKRLYFKMQENMQRVLKDYSEAQTRGDIRPDIKPEFIMYIFNKMVAMISDEELAKYYNSPRDITAELTNFFFYGILNREN